MLCEWPRDVKRWWPHLQAYAGVVPPVGVLLGTTGAKCAVPLSCARLAIAIFYQGAVFRSCISACSKCKRRLLNGVECQAF